VSVALRLALRRLASHPRQTVLTVGGVALGVAVFIFTVAMMDGLVVFFTQRLIRVSPLLTVQPERLAQSPAREALRTGRGGELLALPRPPLPDQRPTVRGATVLAESIARVEGVEGVSVAASVPAVLRFGTVAEPATLVGIEPRAEARVTELPAAVLRGRWDGLVARRSGVVVGVQLADRLGADLGDRLVATGEDGAARELEVVGIMATGLGAVDEASAFVNLPVAQSLAGWASDEGSEIRIRAATLTGLATLRRRLEGVTGYRVETWEETSRASLQLFRTIGLTTYLLTGFVLLVAGLGIFNRLTTLILDKERDVAVLRSFGFSRGAIRATFLLEGVLLGAGGAAAGCLVASAAIAYFTAFPIRFAPRSGAVVAYTELYLANEPRYYAIVAGVALVLSAAAALGAVRRAVGVVPVEVLRGSV
jgi:lipoprotein-releasing system permease protein